MRAALVLLPLSLCASPALAQAAPAPPQLADPATVAHIAGAMQSLSRALLQVKVGGVRAAIEGRKASRAERDLTVGDLARRDDPQFDRHLQQRIADAGPKIQQSLEALNQALPQVAADLQRAHQAVERAIANMPDPNYPKR